MSTKTYDSQCFYLACHFLEDEPELNTEENKRALAIAIQQSVEDWFFDKEHKL